MPKPISNNELAFAREIIHDIHLSGYKRIQMILLLDSPCVPIYVRIFSQHFKFLMLSAAKCIRVKCPHA